MMRRQLLLLLIVVGLCALACQRDLSMYDKYLEPQISQKPDQNMLVIEVRGDPDTAATQVFKELLQTFIVLKKRHKQVDFAAPLARWPKPFDVPREEWIGLYAMPIPEEITELPDHPKVSSRARIEKWEYGTVAEILHVGSYDEEDATIRRLKEYIDQQGYVITGAHEEEYLRGPGMFGGGNPSKYKTIIRYVVKQK